MLVEFSNIIFFPINFILKSVSAIYGTVQREGAFQSDCTSHLTEDSCSVLYIFIKFKKKTVMKVICRKGTPPNLEAFQISFFLTGPDSLNYCSKNINLNM